MNHDSPLTVGWGIFTFALLDADIIDGDVSLDTGTSDSLHHNLPEREETQKSTKLHVMQKKRFMVLNEDM